ncbi:MAG: glycosyltransferase family 2 protein [Minwuiales bacterium]|nr:glycosyltransferase family 2 protein [Minwuiales bacterium]
MTNSRILVFIPAYNDFEALPNLCSEILELSGARYDVLVIDDGSETPLELGEALPSIKLFRMPCNFGLGTCTHIAFDYALAHDYDAVIRLDADGQHSVHDIPKVVGALRDADVVCAVRTNRDQPDGIRGVVAKLVRKYFSYLARILTKGRSPKDVNTGFFGVTRHALNVLNQYQLERFPEPQMFILACRNELRVSEIEILQNNRVQGKSTLSLDQAVRMFYRFSIFVLTECLQGAAKK